MAWGTSNKDIITQIDASTAANFKATNNLLTLQTNHVEEFFEYHGQYFLVAFEKMMEDMTERVVSKMLSKLRFTQGASGELIVHSDCLREYEAITQENIQLDIQNVLAASLNTEVIMQRKMAKQQYLETQGFNPQNASSAPMPQMPLQGQMPQGQPNAGGLNPSQISGGNPIVQANNVMMQQQQALNNPSGYPIAPNGYDTMGNPYWIDPNTGQPTYTPPGSGLGLSNLIQKGAAWAAWLA
jgi:hypothetical protein